MTISLVVPAHNEQEVLPQFLARVTAVMTDLGESYEVVFVNDGSSDNTAQVLADLASADPHVRYLNLARNFGHQIALTAGLEHASGDCVVTLDSDLQHPPEMIPELVGKWREGFEVVCTEKTDTVDIGWSKKLATQIFYRLLNRVSNTQIPLNTADFRLLDRRVVDTLSELPERARFLRGLIAWVGYRQTVIPYEASARAAGQPSYTVRKLAQLALDGITSFSTVPLRVASYLGFLVSLAGFLYGLLVIGWKLRGLTPEGWTTTVCLILFLGGLQLICLGIIGEYVARIYEEVKHRPLYLVREAVGFESEGERPDA